MDQYIDSVIGDDNYVSDISELTPTLTSHDAPVIDLQKVIAETINPDNDENFGFHDDLSDITDVFNPVELRTDVEEDLKEESFTVTGGLVSSTPVSHKRTYESETKDESFVLDNRFNDSLSGLLGSPPPDSALANHPFFDDLQAVLVTDCERQPQSFPKILFETLTTQPHSDIFTREQRLQDRFNKLQAHYPGNVAELSEFYKQHAGAIERDRFEMLHKTPMSADHKQSVNMNYDIELHRIMDRVEQSVRLLEDAYNSLPVVSSTRVIRPRPLLSKKAIRIMEDWYDRNLSHPYPTPEAISDIADKGEITTEQVKKWFANKRNRSNNTRTLTEIAKKKRQLAVGV
ncbi:hypothetical protein FSP39_012311 [Pinctada imbricata]|uniref:Homeobox domain-containing protein n=1 Tax=Pinctada imbricata TaxID=66713 RepID=A0AA88YML6_PINIB|nr:hypothetical protein FSP39_012311 [Pinctada imbricata]